MWCLLVVVADAWCFMSGNTGEGVICRQRWRSDPPQKLPVVRHCPSNQQWGKGKHYFYPTRILEIGLNEDWLLTDTYKRLANQRVASWVSVARRAGFVDIRVEMGGQKPSTAECASWFSFIFSSCTGEWSSSKRLMVSTFSSADINSAVHFLVSIRIIFSRMLTVVNIESEIMISVWNMVNKPS